MRFLLILCLAVCCYARSLKEEDVAWEKYKLDYNKKYDDPAEDQMRKELFLNTKKRVAEHNDRYHKGLVKYNIEVNQFADWTREEMRTGNRVNNNSNNNNSNQKNQP